MPEKGYASARKNESGQTLLIVILIMVVALSVAISLASRNVVNLKLTSEEENSQKALSAAEAGIEQALIGKNAQNEIFGTAKISQINTQQTSGKNFLVNNGTLINKDDGVDVWLTPFDPNPLNLYKSPWNGSLTIYWGQSTDQCSNNASNTMAAIEVLIFTGTGANPTVNRYAFDPCPNGRQGANNFTPAQSANNFLINGVNFNYTTQAINITSGLIVRIIPLYANTVMGITDIAANKFPDLPIQGQLITSTGVSGATQRKVQYYSSNDSIPSEFYYSIFSPQ